MSQQYFFFYDNLKIEDERHSIISIIIEIIIPVIFYLINGVTLNRNRCGRLKVMFCIFLTILNLLFFFQTFFFTFSPNFDNLLFFAN